MYKKNNLNVRGLKTIRGGGEVEGKREAET